MTTSRNYGRSSNRHNHLHSHEHNFHGLRYYYQRCDALSFGSLKRRLKIKNRIVPYLFSINVLLLMQRYYLIVQSICIVEKVFVWAPKKQEVFLFLLDFKVLNWYDKEVC